MRLQGDPKYPLRIYKIFWSTLCSRSSIAVAVARTRQYSPVHRAVAEENLCSSCTRFTPQPKFFPAISQFTIFSHIRKQSRQHRSRRCLQPPMQCRETAAEADFPSLHESSASKDATTQWTAAADAVSRKAEIKSALKLDKIYLKFSSIRRGSVRLLVRYQR